MGVVKKGWELQHKIEKWFKVNVDNFGKRFIANLFFFSILVYGIMGFLWIQYVDKVPRGFDNVLDFVMHGKLENQMFNPLYPVVCSIISMIVIMRNTSHRMICSVALVFVLFIVFSVF